MYLEDVDLAWRLQLAGWQAVFAPKARLFHHLSATGGGALASFYTGRNTIWIVAKDVPKIFFGKHWRRIIGAQFRISLDALRAWRGASSRARLRGQISGLFGLRPWLSKRTQQNTDKELARLERLLDA